MRTYLKRRTRVADGRGALGALRITITLGAALRGGGGVLTVRRPSAGAAGPPSGRCQVSGAAVVAAGGRPRP